MRLHLLQKGERAYNKDLVDSSSDKVNRNEIGRNDVNDNEKRVKAIKFSLIKLKTSSPLHFRTIRNFIKSKHARSEMTSNVASQVLLQL